MNTLDFHEPPFLHTACMRVVWPARAEAADDDDTYLPSAWEERFDMCQMDALIHMLHHLTTGWPAFMRRWLLRRASTLPGLHGRFAPWLGRLAFHAEEGEMIGMSETWKLSERGERERLW